MSKWIAEFDLEDGNTMPEHIDLEYNGAKIDFHCRPLWIPISEGLPESDGRYYVTILNHLPNISNKLSVRILDFWVDGIDFHETTVHWGFYSGFSTSEIIAWMPFMIEPYNIESEE